MSAVDGSLCPLKLTVAVPPSFAGPLLPRTAVGATFATSTLTLSVMAAVWSLLTDAVFTVVCGPSSVVKLYV